LQLTRGSREDPVSITTIARREGLGPEYVAKLLGVLRSAGLVESLRGARGGYRLARPAEQISVWDAIDALGGPFFPADYCDSHGGKLPACIHSMSCVMRPLWRWIDQTLEDSLGSISLADLMRPRALAELTASSVRVVKELSP
jgi:Rrf2 family protein